ncbi:5011_t:CDS:1, partial [Funneliformis caledonium]
NLTAKNIAISVVSSIVGTAILIGIGALLYKWYKQRKEQDNFKDFWKF